MMVFGGVILQALALDFDAIQTHLANPNSALGAAALANAQLSISTQLLILGLIGMNIFLIKILTQIKVAVQR